MTVFNQRVVSLIFLFKLKHVHFHLISLVRDGVQLRIFVLALDAMDQASISVQW